MTKSDLTMSEYYRRYYRPKRCPKCKCIIVLWEAYYHRHVCKDKRVREFRDEVFRSMGIVVKK